MLHSSFSLHILSGILLFIFGLGLLEHFHFKKKGNDKAAHWCIKGGLLLLTIFWVIYLFFPNLSYPF